MPVPCSTPARPRGGISPWLAALVLAALVPLASPPAAAQSAAPPPPQNVMSLRASATAEVAMDTLSITFSTTRDGPDAAGVQQLLRQALDGALAEARRVARPGQVDVRTGNFSLSPRYAPKGGISGWQGSVQLVVEGRDMQAISQLAGRITTLSIARVSHSLSREAREKVEAETTAQAIARFRERAQAQAQLFGFSGYTIREVDVGTDGGPGPVPVMAMRAAPAAAPMAAEALPVEVGKATVSATVSGSVQMVK
jgi:predicted secreted protein